MKTERIIGTKLVVVNAIDTAIVTTESNQTVFVPKHQMDANAETITYNVRKAGEEYTKSDGSTAALLKDRNEFVGCGKASKVDNTIKLFSELQKMGITPSLSM